MGWEDYLSAETLYNTSSLELEQIKKDLQKEMKRQQVRFIEYEKWLAHEFEQIFLWYKNHYSNIAWLAEVEREFKSKLEKSSSIYELVKIVEQLTLDPNIPVKMRNMLNSKYMSLCIAGKLPRDFIVQIRPLIIIETQRAYVDFYDKVNGIFARAKATQVEVFEGLIRKLSTIENEEEARQFIQAAIAIAKSFRASKVPFAIFDEIANKHLYNILFKLLKDLEKKGYINKIPVLNFDISSLQQAIDIVDAQIILKTLNQQEQKDQLISAHELSFALLRTNLYGSKEIEEFLIKQEKTLKSLRRSIQMNDAQSLMILHKSYINFWFDIAHAGLQEVKKNQGKKKKAWCNLQTQILNARKNLQQQGYLPEDFVLDQQYLIMERFESYIHIAYRNSFWKLGESRLVQIDYLRQQLKNVNSAQQAARLIHIAIEDIQQDHQEKSLGFNVTFVKRKSRAAGALQAVLRDCERDNLLPKIVMRQPSAIEQHLAKTIEDYFAASIIFSNREHRGIARRLFSAIRLVEDQINDQKILLIDGQQLIVNLLEQTIKEEKKVHKHNHIVHKLLSFLESRTNSAFVEYLKRAQAELLLTKKLVESYRHVVWPVVEDKLSEMINFYKNNITPEPNENKENGAREANELLIQLRDATNAEQACYLLAYGIRSLNTGFPQLAKKLEEAYQSLRKDGVLPTVPQTEFSETIKKQIKQQTREITELRARLHKIS